jgi:ATP-dependent Clp protease ATP-binding subunit ClpB
VAHLEALGYRIEATEEMIEMLVRQGYHRTLGARPMRRAVERFLQEMVSERIFRETPCA